MKLLIVEDDPELGASLRRILDEEGHVADLCACGVHALNQANRIHYDVIVLDWMLPDIDGPVMCEKLRQTGCQSPILMLTARAEVADRVRGLRAGADDYLIKPFEIEELLARIEALARRAGTATFRFGQLVIDRTTGKVSIAGKLIDLTQRERNLLLELATHQEKPVTRTRLLTTVWGINFDPGTNMLEVYISRLRDKLGSYPVSIETVRGVGYRLRIEHPP